jgi:hypothetical protein
MKIVIVILLLLLLLLASLSLRLQDDYVGRYASATSKMTMTSIFKEGTKHVPE